MSREERFAFGRNWAAFLRNHLDAERLDHARRCLLDLTEGCDLRGRSFVDVGCGSGLHSLAALSLGAAPVVSFDYDGEAVKCCQMLWEHEGRPDNWRVTHGSALDREFLASLGAFDVVYSWGVLHHTGAMWRAIDNTTGLVAPGGLLAIAIYNKAEAIGLYPDGRFGPSRLWAPLKRTYCKLPLFLQNGIDSAALSMFFVVCLCTLNSPIRVMRDYKKQRGMSLRTDVKDWLGGYPYEYAAVDEVFNFVRARAFTLENLKCHGGLRCNEFVFRKAGGQ